MLPVFSDSLTTPNFQSSTDRDLEDISLKHYGNISEHLIGARRMKARKTLVKQLKKEKWEFYGNRSKQHRISAGEDFRIECSSFLSRLNDENSENSAKHVYSLSHTTLHQFLGKKRKMKEDWHRLRMSFTLKIMRSIIWHVVDHGLTPSSKAKESSNDATQKQLI